MRVLLVRPKPHPETIGLQHLMICEPLELEYLAGSIIEEHEVEIVDFILETKPFSRWLEEFRPECIGFTGYITHVAEIQALARQAKAHNPQVVTVVGGVMAELAPQVYTDPAIDYLSCHDGLASFPAFIQRLSQGEGGGVGGIYPRAQGRRASDPLPMPEYPHPARHLVARYQPHYYYLIHRPVALMKTSWGCPYRCSFCTCWQLTNGQYQQRPIEEILDELSQIPQEEVYIVDDNFLHDVDRLHAFIQGLQERKISKRYLVYGRAQFISAHPELMQRLAEVGLRAVIVGLESHRSEDLKAYKKGSALQESEEAVRILQRLGVDCYATIILGMDWDRSDFRALSDWLISLQVRYVNLQPFTPLPGTPAYQEYLDQLRIPLSEYPSWDLAHLTLPPTKMSSRAYYLQILWSYLRILFRPGSLSAEVRRGGWTSLRLLPGTGRVFWQYLRKVMTG